MYQLEVALSYSYLEFTEELAMQWMKAGIRKVELALNCLPVEFNDKEFVNRIDQCNEIQNKCGIEIVSVHLPYGPEWELCSCDDQIRSKAMRSYIKTIQYANRLHPKRYILHPGYPNVPEQERSMRMQNFRYNVSILSAVAGFAKIAVENMAFDCLGNTSAELINLVDGLDNVCVCSDMNHWLQEKNYDAIRKLGSRIEAVHISDYDEIQEKHWLPGDGVSDWNKILDALCFIGYNGPFLYECVGTAEELVKNKEMLFNAFYQSKLEDAL